MSLPAALDFSGRRVVVTGAASGIGAATAELFGGLGADVVGLDIADGSLDLRDPDAIDAAVAALGGVPVYALVNCAGVPQTAGGLNVLRVNFLGYALPDRIAAPPDRGRGRRGQRGLHRGPGLARPPRPPG